MKKIFAAVFCAIFALTLSATEINLPAPSKNGGMALSQALNSRRSIRKFTAQDVSVQILADILWSANGVTRPDGKRTAPSAMNRQEIMIYVTMKDGSFLYDAAAHKLIKISASDLRKYAGRYQAPAYLILVADTARQPSEIYAAVDTGYVSQNIYLAATANGLGTCAMGSIADRTKLAAELKLDKKRLMLVHPLGTPAK